MRTIIFISILISLANASTSQTKRVEALSKIDKVTLFTQGAQVTRSATVALPAGKSDIVFNNVSPQIDRQSIQAKAEGRLTIVGVTQQQNFIKEQEVQDNIKQLSQDKENLEDKIQVSRNNLNVFKQEEALILKNQDLKGTATGIKTTDLKDAADFQRARLTEVYARQFELGKIIKKYETDLEKINRQLIALNQQKDISTNEIIVTVSCKEAFSSNFSVSYLVKKAGWFPNYDVRVKDIQSPLVLQQKANVFQNSGEDWKDVKLVLSTGNPNDGGVQPKLDPWYLRFNYANLPTMLQGKAAGVAVNSNNLQEVVVSAYGKRKSEDDEEDKAETPTKKQMAKNIPIETSTSYQPTTTQYEIAMPYTILNDGKTYTVDINEFELTADYEYYAAPKIEQQAYLTAKLTNWQELNLLNGSVNIFFEGTYLGNSYLDVMNAGDTMQISLGKDKGVVVKRVLQKDYSQKKFLGSSKTDDRQYEVLVRNNKMQPIHITIEDQFPISTTKEIEISRLTYGKAQLDEVTQKISWVLPIDSKKEEKLSFGYSVKYPRDKVLALD